MRAGWSPRRGEICLAELREFSWRPKLWLGEGGLARDSRAKCDQVATIEKRLIGFPPLRMVLPEPLELAEEAIQLALELG